MPVLMHEKTITFTQRKTFRRQLSGIRALYRCSLGAMPLARSANVISTLSLVFILVSIRFF
jgi:hypothetical protein